MDKDTAKSILIANLKGSKKKRSPLLIIAEAIRTLLRDKEYKSSTELAREFEVSRPIIEAFDRMNDQPERIKEFIAQGKILLDTSTKLSGVADLNKRIELAKVVAGLTAFEARYIIDYWKKHRELSPEECKRIVFDSKDVTRKLHLVVVPFEAEEFDEFQRISRTKRLKLEESAKIAIKEWMLRQKQEG